MRLPSRFFLLNIFTFTVIFYPKLGSCEYRVYQYLIRNKGLTDSPPLLGISTLDPVGYIAYHGGFKNLDLTLLRTWICKGNTSYIKTCSPPQKNIESQRPNL